MDKVRVLRIIEYVGPRDWVERVVAESIQGTKVIERRGNVDKAECLIRAATIGSYPEILEEPERPENPLVNILEERVLGMQMPNNPPMPDMWVPFWTMPIEQLRTIVEGRAGE